jgi:hypothetical protein
MAWADSLDKIPELWEAKTSSPASLAIENPALPFEHTKSSAALAVSSVMPDSLK